MTRKKDKARYFLISYSCGDYVGDMAFCCIDGNFPTNKVFKECVTKTLNRECPNIVVIFLYEFKNRSDYLEWTDTSENVQVKE